MTDPDVEAQGVELALVAHARRMERERNEALARVKELEAADDLDYEQNWRGMHSRRMTDPDVDPIRLALLSTVAPEPGERGPALDAYDRLLTQRADLLAALESLADAGDDVADMAQDFISARDVGSLTRYGKNIASIARDAIAAAHQGGRLRPNSDTFAHARPDDLGPTGADSPGVHQP